MIIFYCILKTCAHKSDIFKTSIDNINKPLDHCNDVIMSTMVSQITSRTIVYSTIYWSADQRKQQSSTSLAFVWGIHRLPVNSPHKGPVTRKKFPFDDVIIDEGKPQDLSISKGGGGISLPLPWALIDLGPLLLTWINFNPSMDVTTYPVKYGMKLLFHFQTSTAVSLKFGNG